MLYNNIMENEILNLIKEKHMINEGEKIGVAVSGGVDSMSLLHFLNAYKKELKCEIIAITVDHMLRGERSENDASFVRKWCREHDIVCHKYSVDIKKLVEVKGISVEQGAREGRYEIFNNLIAEKTVDKIALAHHMSDQAETVLLHILRGSGLNGARGMAYIRNGSFIRPFLDTSKEEILTYARNNKIDHITDETNADNNYSRNFLRNIIIPQIKERWEGIEQNLVNFAKSCREDNDFILSHVQHEGTIKEKEYIKIPIVYFLYPASVINRILFDCFETLSVTKDIERKHIELIKALPHGENGKKINLPNSLIAQKEYDYITIFKSEKDIISQVYPFRVGNLNFSGVCEIRIKTTKDLTPQEGSLIIDGDQLPKGAVWRTRKNGDVFTKFGGGTKNLRNYFIDKKITNRVRDFIPVLAVDNEIYCIAGLEISDKVKVTNATKNAYLISKTEIKEK